MPISVRLNVAASRPPASPTAPPVTTNMPVTVTVQLYGPGDVVGIDRREVIRTDPVARATGFEPNYFACADLATAELPWMFTPLRPEGAIGERLRPWICLVVVPRDGGRATLRPRSGQLPVLDVQSASELPPLDDAWAWAHVQVVRAGDALTTVLAERPERSVSRLVCPRRLVPDTAYYACIVPTFEAGRQAGMGEQVAATDEPAWLPGSSAPVSLPVYYHWEFSTGAADDFESLARRLDPRSLPDDFGHRPVDVSVPGSGLPAAGTTLEFEGPLRVPRAVRPVPTWPDATGLTFQTALRAHLDAAPGTGPTVVTPPVYGRSYVSGQSLPAPGAAPLWLADLNLDPRFRAAAALGTRVVQEHQEELVASAWDQLGEIEKANQLLRNAQVARAVGQVIYEKRLRNMPPAVLLQVTAPAQPRLLDGPTTIYRNLRGTALPTSAASVPFRKVARPAGPLVRAAAGTAGDERVRALVTQLASAKVKRSLMARAEGSVSVDHVSARVGTPTITYGGATRSVVELAAGWYWIEELRSYQGTPPAIMPMVGLTTTENVPQPNGTGEPDLTRRVRLGAMRSRFREASAALQQHLAIGVPPAPPPPPPPATSLDTLKTALVRPSGVLDPHVAVADRVEGRVPAVTVSAGADKLATAIAAPRFPQPMFEPLRDLFPDAILPGLEHIPPDTVTVLEPNNQFVEAFLVGLNHELGRELLWRGVPVAPQASYFRRFWDNRGQPGATPAPDGGGDVAALHAWGSALGGHASAGGRLVLLIRGEFARRYPTATLSAVKAASPTALGTGAPKYPEFRCILEPDVLLAGFRLTRSEARGSSTDPGWFFVIQQQPTEPRFGFDVVPIRNGQPVLGGAPARWRDLSWGHLATSEAAYASLTHAAPRAPFGALILEGVRYGDSAAHMARISLRPPLRIAIHAAVLVSAAG
jgi:hypothetical protein